MKTSIASIKSIRKPNAKSKSGPMSLHKKVKQISKNKVLQKFVTNKREFSCMLTSKLIEEMRDLKITSNVSYEVLVERMIELYREDREEKKAMEKKVAKK